MKTVNKKKTTAENSEAGQIRLNRFLAMAGIGSRRSCDILIQEGRVKINGVIVDTLGVRVNPAADKVEFDGQLVSKDQQLIYILLNKPLRTVTTVKDERNRRTVIDVLRLPQRLFPVGRLDYMTSGALLITNDGELSYFLIHPKFQVKKIYRVMLNDIIRPVDLHHFQHGLELDGRKTSPCKSREIRRMGNRSYLEVELHEGRNRQIRRMFEILGYTVEQLHRISFGGLEVGDLKEGEWREVAKHDVIALKKLVEEQKKMVLSGEE